MLDEYEYNPPPNRLAERRRLRKTVAMRDKDIGTKQDVLNLWRTIDERMPEMRFSVKRRLKADEKAKKKAKGDDDNKRNARHRQNIREANERIARFEAGTHNFLGTGLQHADEHITNRADLFYETW
jgi:hypothetical protein